MRTWRRVAARSGQFVVTLLVLVTMGWGFVHLLPGDAVVAMYASADVAMSDEAMRTMTETLAVPDLGTHLVRTLTLDWGMSFQGGSVTGLIAAALPHTLMLAALSGLASTVLGFALGAASAARRGTPADRWLTTLAGALHGMPEMATGILLLLIFALGLGWLPAAGASTAFGDLTGSAALADRLSHLFLPWLTLFLTQLPSAFLVTRAVMVKAFDAPFMLTAAAKGANARRRARVHAARLALLPVLTRFAVRGALMLTGLIVVEAVFSYPGLGSLLMEAVAMRDAPLVMGICTTSAVGVLVAGFVIDLLCMKLDPDAGRAP